MNYTIKVRIGETMLSIPIEAFNSEDALRKIKSSFRIEEIYPKDDVIGTESTIGLDAEPYIPDSIRNELLLLITDLFISDKTIYERRKAMSRKGYLQKLDKLEKLFKHIKTYFNKST